MAPVTMPTIVKVRNVLIAIRRSRPGAWLERRHVARVVAVVLGEDALELAVRGHVEDEEAVRRLLRADVDRGDQAVAVPRPPLGQRVYQPLPRRWLATVSQLRHGVGEQSRRQPAVEGEQVDVLVR